MKGKKIHGNVKCDCGHVQKDHYMNSGWCHHSEHPKAGKCGCTWFHPNVAYIKKRLVFDENHRAVVAGLKNIINK